MIDLSQMREHLEVIGADGVHLSTVDNVEGNRTKRTEADSGSHSGLHRFLFGSLVAEIESNQVPLAANAQTAAFLEEEKADGAIADLECAASQNLGTVRPAVSSAPGADVGSPPETGHVSPAAIAPMGTHGQ